jgi:hypothetical protein
MVKKPIMSAIKTSIETGASVFVPMLLSNISTVVGVITGLMGLVYMSFKLVNEIYLWKKNKRGES